MKTRNVCQDKKCRFRNSKRTVRPTARMLVALPIRVKCLKGKFKSVTFQVPCITNKRKPLEDFIVLEAWFTVLLACNVSMSYLDKLTFTFTQDLQLLLCSFQIVCLQWTDNWDVTSVNVHVSSAKLIDKLLLNLVLEICGSYHGNLILVHISPM
jgi:hypothetical protein